MQQKQTWRWTFRAFRSVAEGCPVQGWYDALPEDHKEEIYDLLLFLQAATKKLWARPYFDPLEGAGGISEIIVPDIRHASGVSYYRIYGYFGPNEREYTFLHATDKKARNDEHGKRIARRRLGEIGLQRATVPKFDFEKRSLVETEKGNGSEG